jgi:hypothetical protein
MDFRIPKRRRIKRYSGPSLASLPPEILVNIARCFLSPGRIQFLDDIEVGSDEYQDVTDVDQPSRSVKFWRRSPDSHLPLYRLLLTCKKVHQVVQPILYEDVELWSARAFRVFISTIEANMWLQKCVRRLTVGHLEGKGSLDRYRFEIRRVVQREGLTLENVEAAVLAMPTSAVADVMKLLIKLPRLRKLAVRKTGYPFPDWPTLPGLTELQFLSDFLEILPDVRDKVLDDYTNRRNPFPNLKTLLLSNAPACSLTTSLPLSLRTVMVCDSFTAIDDPLAWTTAIIVNHKPLQHLKVDPTRFRVIGEVLLDDDNDDNDNNDDNYDDDDGNDNDDSTILPEWDQIVSVQATHPAWRNRHMCEAPCQHTDAHLMAGWNAACLLYYCAKRFPSLKLVQLPDYLYPTPACYAPLLEIITRGPPYPPFISSDPLAMPLDRDLFKMCEFRSRSGVCCQTFQARQMASIVSELRERLGAFGVEVRAPDYDRMRPAQPCPCGNTRELSSSSDDWGSDEGHSSIEMVGADTRECFGRAGLPPDDEEGDNDDLPQRGQAFIDYISEEEDFSDWANGGWEEHEPQFVDG